MLQTYAYMFISSAIYFYAYADIIYGNTCIAYIYTVMKISD
jgi:hypothetical protein